MRTRLVRQKIINPNEAFTNLLASRLDDVRDCLILLDLILTLSSSAVKCNRGALQEKSANNCDSELAARLDQKALFRQHMKAYIPNQAIGN